jgi:hypothetical protein
VIDGYRVKECQAQLVQLTQDKASSEKSHDNTVAALSSRVSVLMQTAHVLRLVQEFNWSSIHRVGEHLTCICSCSCAGCRARAETG